MTDIIIFAIVYHVDVDVDDDDDFDMTGSSGYALKR